MRYVIMGTAGHIDHGKSCLVKALTGTDPDRLKEEKERGITIDLGFADLEYPDGLRVGIVDVPGHERLVRNMLAGAGGIDFVLMAIAADEGVMPQSREHLHICDLLRIKSGIIALTKSDLVDPDWLALVQDDLKDFVRGTFLEGAMVVPVSSTTGHNIEALKDAIAKVGGGVQTKPSKGLFRLPIDRVFTLKGFGTVVTGTAISGAVSVEDTVEILPGGLSTRIRGLHSHGAPIRQAVAGQRVAINLQGVEKDDLRRGDTMVTAGRFSPTRAVDARVEVLPDAPVIKNRGLVHFHLGTSETVARLVLYGAEKIGPGESCYCQLRLNAPVVAQSGDRFIIRRFSPLQTLGGGEVLDPSPAKRKKKDGTADLDVFLGGSVARKIAAKVLRAGLLGMTTPAVQGWLKAEADEIGEALGALKKDGEILLFEDTMVHRDALHNFSQAVSARLSAFHGNNPIKHGMSKEELRTSLRMGQKVFSAMVASLPDVASEKDLLRLKSFKAEVSGAERGRLLEALDAKGFQPPSVAELSAELKLSERRVAETLSFMHKEGAAVRISESLYLGRASYDRMLGLLRDFFSQKPEMTVAEFRDFLGTTRKYALPFLEHLDANNVTLRVGDVRKSLMK